MRALEKIGQIRRGEINVGDVPGSTTERMTIGLALDALEKTNPSYSGDAQGAWEMLNAFQRGIVRGFNPEYRKKKWLTEEEIVRAKMERELADGSTAELMRWIELNRKEGASK